MNCVMCEARTVLIEHLARFGCSFATHALLVDGNIMLDGKNKYSTAEQY